MKENYQPSNEMVNSLDKEGNTPLHVSVRIGKERLKMSELLLKDGNANANILNGAWETPLFFAVRNKDIDHINLLLKYDANPLIHNRDGASVMDIAMEMSDLSVIKALKSTTLHLN